MPTARPFATLESLKASGTTRSISFHRQNIYITYTSYIPCLLGFWHAAITRPCRLRQVLVEICAMRTSRDSIFTRGDGKIARKLVDLAADVFGQPKPDPLAVSWLRLEAHSPD